MEAEERTLINPDTAGRVGSIIERPTRSNNSEFFGAFRQYGFYRTMEVLDKFYEKKVSICAFRKKLDELGYSYNSIFRCHKLLAKYGLITYELNEALEKVISLTKKGKTLLDMIRNVNAVLENK